MKKYLVILTLIFVKQTLLAQEVKLTDSIILMDNKPVAFFYKELNKSYLRYNIELTNINNDLIIKAEVIKFNAPVDELKPFFYYELTFPPFADTFAVYIEDEAFPLVLGKIIRDYKLITNDQLDKNGVANFKSNYPGGPALMAKIQSFEVYLNGSRYFNEQVNRDRTKPVTIINDRIIMQDGIKIGTISEVQNLQVTNQSSQIQPLENLRDYNSRAANKAQLFFANGRKIDLNTDFTQYEKTLTKGEKGYLLYEISRPKNLSPGSYTDQLLKRICYLIEDYAL